jgi:hypothetical protein
MSNDGVKIEGDQAQLPWHGGHSQHSHSHSYKRRARMMTPDDDEEEEEEEEGKNSPKRGTRY